MKPDRIRFLVRANLAALVLLPFLFSAAPVQAMEQAECSMEILVGGVPLPEYLARGTTYVEALEGREYSIRLRNHTAERIAVALSVDGLNTIDAKTTTVREASKWILGPWQTLVLDGWQTSSATARRFFFTTEEDSYGAWLGKTNNLGVITAAVFRERRPAPAPIWKRSGRDAEGPAPLEKRAAAGEGSRRKLARAEERAEAESKSDLSDQMAATGIGRELGHRVRSVRFEAEQRPATVLQVRYEYRDALVRLGVLPRPYARRDDPLTRRERARGFEDLDFAPDPFK